MKNYSETKIKRLNIKKNNMKFVFDASMQKQKAL